MIAAVAGLALLAGARAVRPAPDRAGLDLAPAPPAPLHQESGNP